jgi:hypothetical protein
MIPTMTSAPEAGTPYPADDSAPVDAWSKAVYAELRDWPVAREGEWTRWEPGYLLLTITRYNGSPTERAYLYTAEEELTVGFGFWQCDNPCLGGSWKTDPVSIAGSAKTLVEQWFSGDVRTAVFTDGSGKWCGSTLIERGDLDAQLEAASQCFRDRKPTHVEVRSPTKGGWVTYAVKPQWLRPPALSPERLPR